MTSYYLNKIGSKLPSVQGRQIMNLLERKKQAGEFRSITDLKKKLVDLTNDLLQQRIQPTLKTIYAAKDMEDISSETFNDMLDRIEDDLKAAFVEADNLYEILEIHNVLIKDIALRNLEEGINRLEADVATYEFLIHANEGYDSAVFNTFRDSVGSFTDRNNEVAKFVFVDHRTSQVVPANKAAVVDAVGERLLMSTTNKTYVSPKRIEYLLGTYSTQSEVNAYFPDTNIMNLIDGLKGTYWAVPVLLSSPATDGAYAELALDLSNAQDISFVEIETATSKPLIIKSISYLDSNKQLQTIVDTEIELNKEQILVNFEKIRTTRLVIRLQQKNYTEVQFKQSKVSNVSKVIASGVTKGQVLTPYERPPAIDEDNDVSNAVSNAFLSSDILGLPAINTEDAKRYYEYTIALDNIRVGYSIYTDISIFVSTQKQVDNLCQLGLRVDEVRPVEDLGTPGITMTSYTYPARSTEGDNLLYHGSVEYSAVIELLNAQNKTEATGIIPLLPLNSSRIHQERLVFTKRINTLSLLQDSGSLRFFCDADSTDIVIYKNGLPLTYATDWEFIADGHATGLTVESANTGFSMKRGVQVLNRINMTDIYTASYTPKLPSTFQAPSSLSLLSTIDLIGDLSMRLSPDRTIIVDTSKLSLSTVVKANIYLVILMRRNSTNDSVSPAVEEFMLACGSSNLDKFVEDR